MLTSTVFNPQAPIFLDMTFSTCLSGMLGIARGKPCIFSARPALLANEASVVLLRLLDDILEGIRRLLRVDRSRAAFQLTGKISSVFRAGVGGSCMLDFLLLPVDKTDSAAQLIHFPRTHYSTRIMIAATRSKLHRPLLQLHRHRGVESLTSSVSDLAWAWENDLCQDQKQATLPSRFYEIIAAVLLLTVLGILL